MALCTGTYKQDSYISPLQEQKANWQQSTSAATQVRPQPTGSSNCTSVNSGFESNKSILSGVSGSWRSSLVLSQEKMSLSRAGHTAVTPPLQVQLGFIQACSRWAFMSCDFMGMFCSHAPWSACLNIHLVPLCCVTLCKISLVCCPAVPRKRRTFQPYNAFLSMSFWVRYCS